METTTWINFKCYWPGVAECLVFIANDNDMLLNSIIELPEKMTKILFEVEPMAQRLNSAQREILCTDEETVMDALVLVHEIESLSHFLTSAFDGEWHDTLYSHRPAHMGRG